jgi:hypothetical protein
MGYKPEDFFVGVIDFFAVLLPGALMSFVIADFARHHLFGKALPAIQGEAQGWVVFAFSSYLLGDCDLLDRQRRLAGIGLLFGPRGRLVRKIRRTTLESSAASL